MKNNFPKLALVVSVGLLIASSVILGFLIWAIKNNDREADTMKSEWQTEATRREDLRTIEKSISSIDTERALLESHFAQSSDVVPFLDMIDNLAKSAGAKSEVVFLSITKDGTGLLVSANATGSFSSVYKFLTLLENSPYEVDFNSMDLVKETITDQAGKATTGWSMTLEIKLLSFTK